MHTIYHIEAWVVWGGGVLAVIGLITLLVLCGKPVLEVIGKILDGAF